MASVTALELVNRVMRRLRLEPQSNFASEPAAVVLDLVNSAKEDVLASRDWKSDLRHDGAVLTRGPLTSSTGYLYNGGLATADVSLDGHVVEPGTPDPAYTGDIITRFEYQGDTTAAKVESGMVGTFWRLKFLQQDVGFGSGYVDYNWTGDDTTTAKLKYFVAEYLLPDTVREVVSVTTQSGSPLKLEHVDAGATFDSLFPDMADRYGTPEFASVGGYDLPTTTSLAALTDQEPKLRLILFPIPDDEYRLNYSYYYQHPVLVNPTDKLIGVPPQLVSSIVEKAHADAVQVLDQRVNDGAILGSLASRRMDDKFKSHDPQPARRHVVGSWEGRTPGRRSVRNGFPGVTIEG